MQNALLAVFVVILANVAIAAGFAEPLIQNGEVIGIRMEGDLRRKFEGLERKSRLLAQSTLPIPARAFREKDGSWSLIFTAERTVNGKPSRLSLSMPVDPSQIKELPPGPPNSFNVEDRKRIDWSQEPNPPQLDRFVEISEFKNVRIRIWKLEEEVSGK